MHSRPRRSASIGNVRNLFPGASAQKSESSSTHAEKTQKNRVIFYAVGIPILIGLNGIGLRLLFLHERSGIYETASSAHTIATPKVEITTPRAPQLSQRKTAATTALYMPQQDHWARQQQAIEQGRKDAPRRADEPAARTECIGNSLMTVNSDKSYAVQVLLDELPIRCSGPLR